MRRLLLVPLLALTGLAGCSGQLLKQSQIMDIDNNLHINPTGSFSVDRSWDLKYSYDCSAQKSQGLTGADRVTVIVFNSDDDTYNAEHGRVTVRGTRGAETLHFKRGGTFYVQMDTVCSWRVVVLDLNGA